MPKDISLFIIHLTMIIRMIRQFIKDTKRLLFQRPKLIKLGFITGFCHSLSVILLIAYNINNILIYRLGKGLSVFTMFQYFIDEITRNNLVGIIITLAIIIALGYVFLYPIGMAAIIHFLKNKKNSISKAIGKGTNNFFAMFELNALAFSFGAYTFMITILRLVTLDVINSGFIIGLFIIWGIIVLFASMLWQYAKYIIIEEKIGVFDAIKKSMTMSFTNIGITIKGLIAKTILLIIFYFKMIIIIGVPLLLMYFLVIKNIIHTGNERIIRTIGIITIVLSTYILTTIQVFFITFWYKIYRHIIEKGDTEE